MRNEFGINLDGPMEIISSNSHLWFYIMFISCDILLYQSDHQKTRIYLQNYMTSSRMELSDVYVKVYI